MTFTAPLKAAALAAVIIAGMANGAAGQTAQADPHHPDASVTQPTPIPGSPSAGGVQIGPPDQAGMIAAGMMCQDMMGPDMMGPDMGRGMMGHGMMGRGMMGQGTMGAMPMMGMRRHMMKIVFAIADTDNDGALAFEEVTAVHKRIFDKVDANKDGKVTPDEIQAFMQY